MVKNCDLGHSFSLYGPNISRPSLCFFFFVVFFVFSCGKLAYKRVCYATLSLNRLSRRLQTIRKKSNEQTSE